MHKLSKNSILNLQRRCCFLYVVLIIIIIIIIIINCTCVFSRWQ